MESVISLKESTFHHLKVGKKTQDSGADVTFSISYDARGDEGGDDAIV